MSLTGTYTWIPVEERLPEENAYGQEYPVAFATNSCTSSARFYEGLWHSPDDSEYVYDSPTHWAEPLLHPSQLEGAK